MDVRSPGGRLRAVNVRLLAIRFLKQRLGWADPSAVNKGFGYRVRARIASQRGFTLIEVLASALITTLIATAVAGALITNTDIISNQTNRSEAETLATVAGSIIRGENAVEALANRMRETFGMTSVTVTYHGATLYEAASAVPGAPGDDEKRTVVELTQRGSVVLRGRDLQASDRRILDAFVAQIEAALVQRELMTEARELRPLEEADRLRTALLNSVSHDLRTPLSTVLGSATTLIDYGATLGAKVRRDLLESIREEAERLNRYVGDLLDMSRLEGGALVTRREWTDVREVLGAAIARVGRRLGERRMVRLELKVLADVGLLGMPNAGKSTFIASVSNARPKIADYPFTTLGPNLGVVRVGPSRSFVIADIPGLIEGAAEGAGLGHQFLRHLQRTGLLLHIVDLAPFDESVDPVAEAKAIVNELRKYDELLYEKPRWLVLNKLDMVPEDEREARVSAFLEGFGWDGPVFEISALTGQGCENLCYAVFDHIAAHSDAQRAAEAEDLAADVRFRDKPEAPAAADDTSIDPQE